MHNLASFYFVCFKILKSATYFRSFKLRQNHAFFCEQTENFCIPEACINIFVYCRHVLYQLICAPKRPKNIDDHCTYSSIHLPFIRRYVIFIGLSYTISFRGHCVHCVTTLLYFLLITCSCCDANNTLTLTFIFHIFTFPTNAYDPSIFQSHWMRPWVGNNLRLVSEHIQVTTIWDEVTHQQTDMIVLIGKLNFQ